MKYTYYINHLENKDVYCKMFEDGSSKWFSESISNRDYQEYLAWVAEGNVAEEYIPEEV